ncbi:hypothetical protein GUJ93_ZPchr0001g30550 [Zizania palustris]|uniref:AP2/ERF and B3 domain-containing protein n=1 Tax=Zizania palustris TaxID=103762 RepID=A0A8J5SA48_ZIZPA|nr:hypothetical protein GUJ93_ZPchr0001g30550 [Zizania palustris]
MEQESMAFSCHSGASTSTATVDLELQDLAAMEDDSSMDLELGDDGGGGGGDVVQVAAEVPMPMPMTMPPRQSSRYKGVVPQPNGRWGAQIYERHARVWLGTFPDEEAAARAYDVAALRFRGREAITNRAAAAEAASAGELAFLAAHSKAEIVDMLRKHTYDDELQQGLRRGARAQPTPPWARERLFEKAVTPSDVGKLNRLVVPKQQAEKHFPFPLRRSTDAATAKGVLLNFEDGDGKVWRFRYSYWNSSQSYVLTKGWSRFVREKGLRPGDTVAFSRSACGTDMHLLIDCKKMHRNRPEPKAVATADNARVVKLFGVDIAGEKGGAPQSFFSAVPIIW